MSDTEVIKTQIMRLVAEGRADEAWELAEAVRDQLTQDQLKELEIWIAQNAYEAFRPTEEAESGRGKWLAVAELVRDGETLRDALQRLPEDLQDFLRREAKRTVTPKLH